MAAPRFFVGVNAKLAGQELLPVLDRPPAVERTSALVGHYKPTLNHVAYFLECLQMHGVNLNKVDVLDFEKKSVGSAEDFLKNRSKKFLLVEGRKDFFNNLKDQKKGPENEREKWQLKAMEKKFDYSLEKSVRKKEFERLNNLYLALSDFKVEGYKKFW